MSGSPEAIIALESTRRATTAGFPTADDIAAVQAFLDQKRPVAEPISYTVKILSGDNLSVRAASEASVAQMLHERGAPASSSAGVLVGAQTIYAAWVSEAIGRVVKEFDLTMADHVMPNNGCIAVPGTVTYQ
jgi:hypothetical protein